MPIELIVGLGNPGEKYQWTRHNIGLRIALALRKDPTFAGDKVFVQQSPFYKDTPFMMNEYGPHIKRYAAFRNINSSEILIVYDDFSIPFETLRVRLGGSSGGHNGLRSILDLLGEDIPRLRVGIGPVPDQEDPKDFVLKKFSKSEEAKIESTILPGTIQCIKSICSDGLEKAMNKFNGPLTPTLSRKGRGEDEQKADA